MIAVVLAGGYAKRLWPLTKNRPKALLPIAGKPIIDYVVEKLAPLEPPMSKILLSTNQKFQVQFQKWLETSKHLNIELIPENSSSEEEKLGAIRALADIVHEAAPEDVLVLAGDSLFTDTLGSFIHFFSEKHAPTVALYRARNLTETRKGSTVKVDEDGRILEFEEKPMRPRTTLVGACLYAFPAGIKRKLGEYLQLGLATDQPGKFIEWLHKQEPVFGFMLKDYLWDIGTLDSYRAANEFFTRINQQSGNMPQENK
jgi:glucose-1-phosphate thymidylyltransferase